MIVNEYHYIRNYFVRKSDCTYISFYGHGPVTLRGFLANNSQTTKGIEEIIRGKKYASNHANDH